jgi:hypothetical protein
MFIKQFEVFHGMALTKLIRSEKPVSVSLIETRPTSEDWRIYGICDADLFVKHRASSTSLSRGKGGHSWQFIFSSTEIARIHKEGNPVFVALICGQSNIKNEMEICFLEPDQIEQIFPLDDRAFSFTVRSKPGNKLWVIVDRKVKVKVARDAIEQWDIPGR